MNRSTVRQASRALSVLFVICVLAVPLVAQQTYLTFTQTDLALKKANPKIAATIATFVLRNETQDGMTGASLRTNGVILALLSGQTNLGITDKGKSINISFPAINLGDSVVVVLHMKKKSDPKITQWKWADPSGPKFGEVLASEITQQFGLPNGGDLRDYLYKRVISRPSGLVLGAVLDVNGAKWIRYMKSDYGYFPMTGEPRCLDSIVAGKTKMKPFVGELKNPKVAKHNNALLGELHALKLAIIANDFGVTDSGAVKLGDLVYNDAGTPADPMNGQSLRQIAALTDTALSLCELHEDSFYIGAHYVISRVNQVFAGPYTATSMVPLHLVGTKTLADAPFLTGGPPSAGFYNIATYSPEVPEAFTLHQNYPNPFNPATTIAFNLIEPSMVTVSVYNVLGQQVASLLHNEEMDEGEQAVEFNAAALSSGVYYYRLAATGASGKQWQETKRMMLVK